ncbi:calcium channel flower isoform X2 [Anthonomus grandis grandis]|uniref:calcium channel flower isoform X2 n=1 Tax=Anthonomus grandis grandis TaxID=2921223 RepID=UPI0021658E6A|nr:calcium channel flower isoform X2 [Anthonomus grandis grandis]
MSLQDKIAALMARPNQDLVEKDEVPWYLKYGGRILGTVGGFFAIFLGAWNCIGIVLSVSVYPLLAGIFQMLAGFLLLCVEAPCCCMFIDHVQRLSDMIDRRPYWNRAAAYVIMAIPAPAFDFGFSTFFGSGLIFATGIVYGMMALGKKASREDMAAVASPQMTTSPQGGGMGHHTDHQRATLMEDPDVWRPT